MSRFILKTVVIIILLSGLDKSVFASGYSDFFADSTLYVTILHQGNNTNESIRFGDYYYADSWTGRKVNLDTTLNYGYYRLEIRGSDNRIRFIREFDSAFKEWRQTDEAKIREKQISEIIQIPYPVNQCTLALFSRDNFNRWTPILKKIFPPGGLEIGQYNRREKSKIIDWEINGQVNRKIDLLLVAAGYSSGESDLFFSSCDRILTDFFAQPPFSTLKKEFNCRLFFQPADSSGITSTAAHNRFGLQFGFLGMDRYLMPEKISQVYKAIAGIPADYIILIGHSEQYGGGGIYNNITTLSGENYWSSLLFKHEFGHSFAGLGDEYYTGGENIENVYPGGIEPFSPNITIHPERQKLKWQTLVDRQQDLPTPWHKLRFDEITDSISTLNATLNLLGSQSAAWQKIKRQKQQLDKEKSKMLSDSLLSHVTGAFQGAGYHSNGFFRPALNCIMFSASSKHYDAVCQQALTRRINFLTKQW